MSAVNGQYEEDFKQIRAELRAINNALVKPLEHVGRGLEHLAFVTEEQSKQQKEFWDWLAKKFDTLDTFTKTLDLIIGHFKDSISMKLVMTIILIVVAAFGGGAAFQGFRAYLGVP